MTNSKASPGRGHRAVRWVGGECGRAGGQSKKKKKKRLRSREEKGESGDLGIWRSVFLLCGRRLGGAEGAELETGQGLSIKNLR